MSEAEIKKLVNSEINKIFVDSLDKEMKKVLAKKNSQTRAEMIQTIKDSMEAVFKVLWMKRDFWKTDVK